MKYRAAAKGRRLSLLAAVCLISTLLAVPTAEASRSLPAALTPALEAPVTPAHFLEEKPAEPQPSFRLFGDLTLPERPLELVQIQKTASGVLICGLRLNVWQTGGLSQNRSGPSFQGLWTDPVTGIAYARNRWYDARTASWLSEDPKGAVDSPNLYAFVGWGPQAGRDPMGLSCLGIGDPNISCRESLYVGEGYAYRSYRQASEVRRDPNSSAFERGVFGGLQALTFPVAMVEEYGVRTAVNTPHRVVANVESGSELIVEGAQEGDGGKISVGVSWYCAAFCELGALATPWSSEVRAMRMPRNPTAAEPRPKPTAGETTATRSGKETHRILAEERRLSGQWDEVNVAITDAEGNAVQVPRRANLKTGDPVSEAGTQTARPDAVNFGRRLVLDDKPIGRNVMKDRQEIIRFIRAYEASEGVLPKTIAIQRYNPATGLPIRTDLFTPADFLPAGGS